MNKKVILLLIIISLPFIFKEKTILDQSYDLVNNSHYTTRSQIVYDASVPFIHENSSNVIFDGRISQNEYTDSYTDSIGIAAHWEHNGVNLSVAIEVMD